MPTASAMKLWAQGGARVVDGGGADERVSEAVRVTATRRQTLAREVDCRARRPPPPSSCNHALAHVWLRLLLVGLGRGVQLLLHLRRELHDAGKLRATSANGGPVPTLATLSRSHLLPVEGSDELAVWLKTPVGVGSGVVGGTEGYRRPQVMWRCPPHVSATTLPHEPHPPGGRSPWLAALRIQAMKSSLEVAAEALGRAARARLARPPGRRSGARFSSSWGLELSIVTDVAQCVGAPAFATCRQMRNREIGTSPKVSVGLSSVPVCRARSTRLRQSLVRKRIVSPCLSACRASQQRWPSAPVAAVADAGHAPGLAPAPIRAGPRPRHADRERGPRPAVRRAGAQLHRRRVRRALLRVRYRAGRRHHREGDPPQGAPARGRGGGRGRGGAAVRRRVAAPSLAAPPLAHTHGAGHLQD